MERLKSGLEFIFSSYKRTAAILFIAALTLAIPITITLVGQQQDIRQRAATSPAPPCNIPASLGVGTGYYGDVNGDGQVTSADSSLILQFSGGLIALTPAQIEAADVNGPPNVLSSKGDVNSIDSKLILQYVAGLISTFPVCSSSPTPTTPPRTTNTPTPIRTPTPTGVPSTDTIPPRSIITSPAAGSTQTSSFAVSISDSDTGGSGLAKCEYAVTDYNNGFTVGRTIRACNSQIFITVGPNGNCRTEGANKCTVRVDSTDNAGNLASLSFRSFSITYTGTGGPPTATPNPTRAPTPTVPSSSLIPGCGSLGDVNGDGKINSVDQLLIQQYNAGLIPISRIIAANADVNRDGKINSVDQLLIQQYNAGLISTFPGCNSSPTPTPTRAPTSAPTPTRTPTPTGFPSGTTSLNLTITMTGIGVSQNTALGINNNPKRPQRNVEVTIVNSGNQQVDLTKSTVNYDSASGKYKGNVNLGSKFVSGSYLVKVRLDNTLRRTIPGIQNITSGQTYTAPEVALVSGDIIQDNEINLLDYNALLSCIGTQACGTKVQADMNDDGKVDELDLNVLYAGFAKRKGD